MNLNREVVADWVESALLVRGGAALGLDALNDFAADRIGTSPAQVSLAVNQMSRRAEVLGELYPFTIHPGLAVVARNGARTSPYAALTLLASGGPARHYLWPSPDEAMAVVFEKLTAAAVARLWGPAGRAIRFGWPSDVGRPPEFPAAVAWLAKKMGLPEGAGYRPPRRKDGGVDVVGWRPFADRRSGFPIVLVQCTLQENLLVKADDVDRRLWASWLAMDLEPVVALATPQTVPAGTVWDELSLKGLVLERLRLAGLLPAVLDLPELAEWCTNVIDELAEHMGEVESR